MKKLIYKNEELFNEVHTMWSAVKTRRNLTGYSYPKLTSKVFLEGPSNVYDELRQETAMDDKYLEKAIRIALAEIDEAQKLNDYLASIFDGEDE